MTEGTAPYWLDAPYEPRPPLTGEHEVDACVIGGGVAGLSCAMRLARHGVETILLEAGTVSSGASGRNGGFLIAGTALFPMTRVRASAPSAPARCTPGRSPRRRTSTRLPPSSTRAMR